jgi:hypothetical protein
MKKFTLALVLALCTLSINYAVANNPPSTKTAVEAKCAWGSSTASPATPITYNKMYASAQEWRIDHAPNGECNVGLVYMPNSRNIGVSELVAFSENGMNPEKTKAICVNGSDPTCDPNKWAFLLNQSTFYKCTSDRDLNCVYEFSAVDANGVKVTPTFLRSFPDSKVRPGFSGGDVKYPVGGNPGIWSINTPNGEVKILINGWFEMSWDSRGGRWEPRPGNQFQLFLLPIKESPVLASSNNQYCYARDKDTCITLEPSLPSGYTFKVSLNLTNSATMFLNGRLDKPIVYTENIAGGTRFTIEAAPSPALSVAQWVPKSIIPKSVIDKVGSKVNGPWYEDVLKWSNSEFFMSGGVEASVELLNGMLPYIGDRANFVQYVWSATNNPSSDRYNQSCQKEAEGQILGVVSTNATAYRGDPPTYNRAEGALEYEIAAPHFMPDGKTDSIGKYAINMNAKFLQCILGVSKVPNTAQVGLTYGSGEVSVSTLAVKQDKDWLRVQLDNFHFSAPKITIKFASTAPSAQTPTTASTPVTKSPSVAAPAKKTTITCTKGKLTKKIIGVNPKCPKGFSVKK